jgi:dihydroneopterin aldolase
MIGGGLSADAVRAFDHSQKLDSGMSHELAVEALGLSLQMAVAVMPHAHIVESVDAFVTESESMKIELLDVRPFLRTQEAYEAGECLPHNWSATSDSIAARIATVYRAEELVLLKSTLPVHCDDWARAAQIGLVDEHFPRAVKGVKSAYCVNLADPLRATWKPLSEQRA